MPPKVKITKNDIIQTALDLLRKEGEAALNARSIAQTLGCSTQPIFSNFTSMEELEADVYREAYELYLSYIKKEVGRGIYPEYKAFGMAYIRFAKEEKEPFKLLFMCDRKDSDFVPTSDFNDSVEMIMKATGLSKKSAELMHLEMWTCVHGIATMSATSFLTLDEKLISNIITDVYQGVCARHLSKEKV